MAPEKRKRLSLADKVKVIKYVNAGNSHAAAAMKFGVARPTVVKIMKEKEQILLQSSGSNRTAKIVKVRAKCPLVESMLHAWHIRAEIDAPDLNVTGDVLKTKALHFRDMLLTKYGNVLPSNQMEDLKLFKASNGWLENYKNRFGTTSVRRCGEHSSTDPETIEKRMVEIRNMLLNVPLSNIFNADESALQYRTTSSRSYVTVNSDKRGVKRSKERMTFTPIISASGEKLELQVIGKSKSPRAMKGININKTFNVYYEHQSKAWQDGSSMLRLLHRFNKVMRQRRAKLFMLLDNCSSHVWAAKLLDPTGSQETSFAYGNIVIIFFPPNATSDCQPLDQGIIRCVKAGFRKAQLHALLIEYEIWQERKDEEEGKFPISDHTHIRNGMTWLKQAWDNLQENTIRRCFAKAKCLPLDSLAMLNSEITRRSAHSCNNDVDVDDLALMLQRVQMRDELADDLGLKEGQEYTAITDLITFDDSDPTGSNEIDEEDILAIAMDSSGISLVDLTIDEEGDVAVDVSISTAISSCKALRSFLSMSPENNSDLIAQLAQCELALTKEQRLQKNAQLVQPTISTFFNVKPQDQSLVQATSSASPELQTTDSHALWELPSSWEGMNKLYHGYNCEGSRKGVAKSVESMNQCAAHLRAWVKHVGPDTPEAAIAQMHIQRIEQELRDGY